jgi:leucyl aminopeptidase
MKNCALFLLLLSMLPAVSQGAVRPEFADPDTLPAYGVLVVPVRADMELPGALDEDRRKLIAAAAADGEFEGKSGEVLVLHSVAGYGKILLLGLGDDALLARDLQDVGGRIVSEIGRDKYPRASVLLDIDSDVTYPAALTALGLQLGGYRFDKYKSPDEGENAEAPHTRYVIYTADSDGNRAHWSRHLSGVADGVSFARDLISEPANVIYPESFVARTREAFSGLDNVSVEALDVRDMERLGMGALLGVGMGSERPPRLLIVEYRGADRDQPPLAFVGKGVTFDTGGISLKNPTGMWKMKYDMSGAAAATGALLALAKREAKVNAVAIAALVENMPSQRAQRPGDVRKTMSGKTIEVLNTDAEGRLILSDAVWYAQQEYRPALLVDLATLTGSVRIALGTVYGGLFTRDDRLAERISAAGVAAGEELWRLPLHETFREAIKSDIADIKNTAAPTVYGGASVGAEVIGSFVQEGTPWAHLDIAGKAWADAPQPTVPKGAAGWGVRLLNQLVMDYYEN